MRVYVAGALADVARVRSVQDAVVAAGHELTLDWSAGPDVGLQDGYESAPEASARIASADLDAVLAADAVVLVLGEHEGRGMWVELGAALARARAGDLRHVVAVGPVSHESVFLLHPAVRRVGDVAEWLAEVG